MIIFIDESGIHKKVDHSSFALSYVKFDNCPEIESKIIEVEKKLNIDQFHWAETIWRVKEKFMDEVLKLDFEAKVAIIKNPINPSVELEKVLLHTIVEKNIRTIYIDGKKPKWFENRIKKILRDKGLSVKKLQTVKSSQYAGTRLADMVAGLARTYYDKKNLDKIKKYYKRLEKKIIVVIK
jgi:hypothetical protein